MLYKHRRLLISTAIITLGVFIIAGLVFGDKQPETPLESNWSYTYTTSPVIVGDSASIDWGSYTPVIDTNVHSEVGDTAMLIVAVDPNTQEVVISGTINDSPIIHAEVEVIIPSLIQKEELGDVSVTLSYPLNGSQTPVVGLNYTLYSFSRGRIRLGFTGAIGIIDIEESSISASLSYRKGNLGLSLYEGVNTNLELRTQIGINFYI